MNKVENDGFGSSPTGRRVEFCILPYSRGLPPGVVISRPLLAKLASASQNYPQEQKMLEEAFDKQNQRVSFRCAEIASWLSGSSFLT
jgi:hypothetical protein